MEPFVFRTSVESIQLTGLKAASLRELNEGLEKTDGSSVYHHTHRFYRNYAFLNSSNRSDFDLWVGDNLKEAEVSERMSALDLRDYITLADLRQALLATLEPLKDVPGRWDRQVPPGMEFHFCRSVSLVLPAGHEAGNLEEFIAAIEKVDVGCLYHHLIEAPLHSAEGGRSNHFSGWLRAQGFPKEAQAVADIDPYRGNLEDLRQEVLGIFQARQLGAILKRAVGRLSRETAGEPAAQWLRHWRQEG